MKTLKIIAIVSALIFIHVNIKAQCPTTKYGIVPVWPQGWDFDDKENWYQMMSNKGMGYSHSIYTWAELEEIQNDGQLSLHINYIAHLKNDYNFKYHLLIRNPSITFNHVPDAYAELTFEDTVLVNAFYEFSIEMIDSFAVVLDYLTIGGESDVYFESYPNEMENYVNLLSDIADYVHGNYPSIKYATTLTLNHGIQTNDTLWQLTKNFSDILSVTYWPLNHDFTVTSTVIEDVDDKIAALLLSAGSKPVIIKESGLPTSPLLNSSDTLQAQFVEELFRQTMYIDQIEIVGWDFLADYDKARVDYWVNFQQIYTPEFRAYCETLGLMDTLGNHKLGYDTYLQMLDTVCIQTSVTDSFGTDGRNILPKGFSLLQNYPNPFNPQTTISYQLPVFSKVTLKIYDVLGQEVRTLINENKSAGFHSMVWDVKNDLGAKVSSGVYFYQLKAGKFVLVRKMILLE